MIDFNFFSENISDEMLAADIDVNTAESENLLIEISKSDGSMLAEGVDLVNGATSFGSDFNWGLHKGDYGFWELGLPPSVTETEPLVATDSIDDVSEETGDDWSVSNTSKDNVETENGSIISFTGCGRCECGCGSFGGHGNICTYCRHPYSAHSRYKK